MTSKDVSDAGIACSSLRNKVRYCEKGIGVDTRLSFFFKLVCNGRIHGSKVKLVLALV